MIPINPLMESLVGHRALRATREQTRAPSRPERAPRDALRQGPASGLADTVMEWQRAAGNRAVTSALTASRSAADMLPITIQRAPADTAGNASGALQVGAIWNAQVVLPLARAAERIGRDKPDLKGARPDVETALETVTTLKGATPGNDPNHVRFQIVERRVRGVLELVDQRLGQSPKGHAFENQMIEVRNEVAAIGPTLQHMPDLDALLQTLSAEVAAKTPAGGSAASTPETEAPPKAPAGVTGPTTAGASEATPAHAAKLSIAEAWQTLVVDPLWSGQRALEESPDLAYFDWGRATMRMFDFFNATPEDHPNHLKLHKLIIDVSSVQDLIAARSPETISDPLLDRAEEAYTTSVAMVEYISGHPATEEAPAAAEGAGAGATEPDFTWERERPPVKDDTALERP